MNNKDQFESSADSKSVQGTEVFSVENGKTEIFESADYSQDKQLNPWIERIKGLIIIGFFFAIQSLAGIFMVILIATDGTIDVLGEEGSYIMAMPDMFKGMVIAECLGIIILIAIYNFKILRKLKAAISPFGPFVVKIIGYFALLWVATIFFSLIDTTLFPDYLDNPGENQALIEEALSMPTLVMITSICLTAPIIEEYVFRFGIIKKLLYGMNKYVAAVIAALIFSFAHIGFSQITDPSLFFHLMLGYIGQALVFGLVYAKEDNLTYSITLHILNNAQAVILIIFLSLV